MTSADSDRPSHRRVMKRRAEDIAFLERVMSATRDELWQMADEHRRAPQWKRIAIQRRIRMAEGGSR